MAIVALVDGSAYAGPVCALAGWAGVRTGEAVEVVHVLGRREGGGEADLSGSIRLGARTALLEELAEIDAQRAKLVAVRGRAILEDAAALVREAGAEASVRLRHGDLVETVAAMEPRLIVMGKRGEAADFASAHLGSNLERVLRATASPVLVASREVRDVTRVLVAWDGGASAIRAVDAMARSPLFAGLEVEVASVGPPRGTADAVAMLKAGGIGATFRTETGQPDEVLPRLAEEDGFDMLVMGSHGHSRIRALLIGSTTTAVVRACRVPVMIVR